MTNDNKQVLVTGGAGFIGSHLVDRLLEYRYHVTVLDNFATGQRENLVQHEDNPLLSIYEVDITQAQSIQAYFEGIQWVFHLAALADIVPSIQQPLKYHQTNVDGTINVLEAARSAKVQRYIYAASASCYGFPDQFPTPENAPIRSEYPYALTKYVGEQYVLHWNHVYSLPCVSLRLFNVFGPRSRTTGAYGAVFGVFLAQKLARAPFTIVGDGTQTRDFTFVSDVVEAFIKVAESDLAGEIFNVGSGDTYSINYLIELLQGDKTYIPKRPGEPDCTFADIKKIGEMLGWKPKTRFEDGVQIMLDNIGKWGDAPLWNSESIAIATQDWFAYLDKGHRS